MNKTIEEQFDNKFNGYLSLDGDTGISKPREAIKQFIASIRNNDMEELVRTIEEDRFEEIENVNEQLYNDVKTRDIIHIKEHYYKS